MVELPNSHVFRRVGVAVVVVGALTLASGRAPADCGDHVTILDGQTADRVWNGPGTVHDQPKPPCHGPSCSNQPSTPFAPPIAPANHFTDVKACPAGAVDQDEGDSRGVAPPESHLAPVDRPTSIFHPPRA
jgi:hypothetical protein